MNQKTLANFFLAFLFLAITAQVPLLRAAQLINVNTADQASLETLNGVGPSKAQAIISYRTQNGPFAKIEDIMNVSGIGTATFNNIKDYITVGDNGVPPAQTAATSSIETQTQAQSQTQAAGAGPPTLTARITTDGRVMAGGGSYFSAVAYGTESLPLPNARFVWNFGDGATAEGAKVFHVYSYPGRYAVSATSAYNYSAGLDRVTVEAARAAVSLEAPGDGSLIIRNLSKTDLNIGLWLLGDSGKSFVIPEDTLVLAGEGVRFTAVITGLGGTRAAELLYPNGALAAAATVSADSPLRGERIVAVTTARPVAVPEPEGEVLGTSTPVAPPAQKNSSVLWLSLGALAVLLVGGVAGVRYLERRPRGETSPTAEEFEIE